MPELFSAIAISASGMRAQSTRIRVITENMANADTTGLTPGADPYVRKTISFKDTLDKEMGVNVVKVDDIKQVNKKPFETRYIPDHPAADANGYVKIPNVNTLVESTDMREAQRSYEANLGMIEQTRGLAMQTIDMLRR